MPIHFPLNLILIASFLLSFSQIGKKILFPIQLFTTWIHECWHAATALLLGGSSISISLSADGSGLTQYQIRKSKMRHAIIASSGYLGASASGCLLFYFAIRGQSHPLWLQHIYLTLGGLIALSLVFWVRNTFGLISGTFLMTALGAFHFCHPLHRYAEDVLLLIATQTALNALFDIHSLFSLGSERKMTSDAHTMQKLFYLPFWFWAFSWLIISGFMMYKTVHFIW